MSVQHIIDWKTGEAYFAIVCGTKVILALRECRSWAEARLAYRAFAKRQS